MPSLASIAFGLTSALTVSTLAFAMTDKEFISDAIKGDNSEVNLGQLVMSKGGTEAVRSFGQTLVNDHSKNKSLAEQAAAKIGVTPPTGMTPEAEQEMKKLRNLSGGAFDSEIARYMVRDHEKDIADFKKQASEAHDPVQQFAAQSLPTLEKHLQLAKNLEAAK